MKRVSIFTIFLSAVLLLGLATTAFPQDPQTSQGKRAGGKHGKLKKGKLKKMDANHDGQVTQDEWKGKPKKFNKLDANHDGVITKEEMKAGHQKGRRSV